MNDENLDNNLKEETNGDIKKQEDVIKSLFKPPRLAIELEESSNEAPDEKKSKWNPEVEKPAFVPYTVISTASVPTHSGPGRKYPMVGATRIKEKFTVFEIETKGELIWGRVSDSRWVILNFTRREH